MGCDVSEPNISGPCNCTTALGRDETDRLRTLIGQGMGQWEASRLLWGPATAPTERKALAEWVWEQFHGAFPWLTRPEVAG